MVVPQWQYVCGTNQKRWTQKPSIHFSTSGTPGVRLSDALARNIEDMDDGDGFPFDIVCGAMTLRIHVWVHEVNRLPAAAN